MKNRRNKRFEGKQRIQDQPLLTAEWLRTFDAAFSEAANIGAVLLLGFEPNSDCPWKVDDQRFFRANSKRSFRLRRIYPEEYGDLSDDSWTHVLVRQLRPGLRDKRGLGCKHVGFSLDSLPEDETFYVVLWEEIASGRIETQQTQLGELLDRAAAMEHAASSAGGAQ